MGFISTNAYADATAMEVFAKTKFGGNLQAWYVDDHTISTDVRQNFKIRRAELKFSGNVSDGTRWFTVVDFAKAIDTSPGAKDTKFLQDMGLGFSLSKDLELVVGQMRIPGSWETLMSSGDIVLPERAMVTRSFGDRRDLGAQLIYTFLDTGKFSVMASNGVNGAGKSTNVDESNSTKDVNARLELTTKSPIVVGAYVGSQVVGDQGSTRTKSHGGIDFVYRQDPVFIAFDYVDGKENDIQTKGAVATIGYKISSKFQFVTRFDTLRKKSNPEVISEATVVSLHYFVADSNSEIRLTYTGLKNAKGNGGSYESALNENGDLMTLAFLAKF